MKLGLSQFAQIAEVIAAVAVVVSLIYVGREVQSNTAAVQGAAMQAINTTDADALLTIAADSELAEIVRIGYAEPSQLPAPDSFRFLLFMRQFWLSMQNIYQQADLGLIDESVWGSYRTIICGMYARAGPRATWMDHRAALSSGFVAVVEACATS